MSETQSAQPSAYYLLEYRYVEGILEKRGPYREAHLSAAKSKESDGKIVLAGAFGTPPEGALFVWRGASIQEIEEFVATDPYKKNGLVTSYSIKPYAVVIGSK